MALGMIGRNVPRLPRDTRQLFTTLLLDESAVRTKPQAPQPLRRWLSSSFVAGIGCESQEVRYCDSPTQNDARRTPAPQLLRQDDPVLHTFRRAVRTTLWQVTRQAWPGTC